MIHAWGGCTCGAPSVEEEQLGNGRVRLIFECGGEVTLQRAPRAERNYGGWRRITRIVCGAADPEGEETEL